MHEIYVGETMMDPLVSFLRNHADASDVWFLVPSGIIYGKLGPLESKEPRVIGLLTAYYYSGGQKCDLDFAIIRTDQILGWGENAAKLDGRMRIS